MNEMSKTRKKRLMYINIFTVSILCLAVFGQVYFSATKLFAKEPLSLTLVEEKVSENQAFHLDISDSRGVEELNRQVELEVAQPTIGEETDSVENESIEIKRELKLLIPEGITFDAEAEKAMLQEDDISEEIPNFNWNESERSLTISMDASRMDVRILLTASVGGEYTFELSDVADQISPQQLKVTVEGEQKKANISPAAQSLTMDNTRAGGEDLSTYDPNAVADVSDWPSFIRALGNVNISGINITSSFAVPANPRLDLTSILTGGATSNTSGSAQYVYMGVPNIGRKVVIEGNNHLLDFGAIALCFYNTTGSWDLTWQNMEVYHGNYYGFTTFNDLSTANQQASAMRYHNITNYGNQLMHSPSTDVFVSGKTSTNQVATYTTEFRTNWAINATNQINLYITNLTVLEDAEFQMSTLQGGNIHLIGSGSLTIGKNAKVIVDGAQNNLTGESDAQQTNLWIPGGGSVTLQEGALLQLTPKPQYAALGMNGSGSRVSIGKGAQLNISSTGHTNTANDTNRNIVRLGAGATLEVAEEGILDVRATGMGTSPSNLIHVQGNATFRVAKKGIFNAMSDSTATGHNLIYFSSSGSTFQFADAQRVNLERTTPISGATATNNGLINIAGSGGTLNVDIQKVSMWEAGNFDTEPTMSWTPMYGMLLTYSGVTPTITSASSLDQANIDHFKNNFTTRNVQRVLYEYIPDVNVAFTSTATDEVDSPNSTTITGVTNPGAYVRLSDVPINDTVTKAMDPSDDKVLSPVTSTSSNTPEFTNNFTIQADSSGNFSYTVPAGNHFAADSTIYAYSFLNGKYDEATQIVLDKTPPSGEPKDFYAGMGAAVPDPSVFVQNPTDTNPTPQTFTYEYSDKNDTAELEALMEQIGTHTVYVNLLDEAGNKTEIASNLIILETSQAITGASFDAPYLDIRDLSDTELIQYILDKSKPEAYSIVDGVKTDISSLVTVTDFGGLNDIANIQPKEYIVTLTVKAADSGLAQDITGTIKVTVVDVDAVLTVEFINELGQVLPGYTITIDSQVGDKIDLTKEERVTKQLTDLESAGYEIAERPDNETEVVINNTEVTVRYKLQGILSLASAPNALDFGSLTYNATTKRVDDPSIDQPLIVTDTRADTANGWTLTASLSTPMRNTEGQELVNALRYVYRGKETILDTNAQTVFLNADGSAGSIDISNSWGSQTGTDGVKLQIESSDIVHTGNYVGVITWKVMAGQP
ncbi:pectate lyase-like adhesive domain-containing protein [Enterococcus wangshanyuanii]|uniref:WxL domain-containing protein n=1 Tax=Enterococcus wangshanyuanii TaxID=2005703 RepID=A0ABQ1P4D5_9ENTE|nr:pectate lyase-like adhesive domain-containing protein [Enterococcus wangshanyuanii]GGC90766.1 hypothetical protein GCM10011573_20490 [Enterococcus wangshanyuanii]